MIRRSACTPGEAALPGRPAAVKAAPTAGWAAVQAAAGNGAVASLLRGDCCPVQRNCYTQFGSYDEARRSNDYSSGWLEAQKDDRISEHQGRLFGWEERTNILWTNKMNNAGTIRHDDDPKKELYQQDMDYTPHIDHRFPKSQGGSNSFRNARVMPASANIGKGAKREGQEREPSRALAPYADLDDSQFKIWGVGNFTASQKEAIYAANRKYYGVGSIVSDVDGTTKLGKLDSSDVAHVDHVIPKSAGGCNYYFNAKVIAADENIQKGGRRRRLGDSASDDEADEDWDTGQQTLAQYFKGRAYSERAEDLEDM